MGWSSVSVDVCRYGCLSATTHHSAAYSICKKECLFTPFGNMPTCSLPVVKSGMGGKVLGWHMEVDLLPFKQKARFLNHLFAALVSMIIRKGTPSARWVCSTRLR